MPLKRKLKKNIMVQMIYNQYLKLYSRTSLNLEHFALDLNLKNGGRDYKKFVIVSRGRSGTNLLRSLMNSHSRIVVFGEIFRRHGKIGWNMPGYHPTHSQLSIINHNPVQFIEKHLFRKFPIKISAVGFKLFYYHAHNDEWASLWPYIINNKDIYIIHFRRENILANQLSLEIAFRTNQWENKSADTASDQIKIALEYQSCLNHFMKTREFERQTEIAFKEHSKINVTYEELCDNREKVMKQIYDFLSLEYEPVKTNLRKQNTSKLSDKISNYYELKRKFANSPWAEFFEE
jgi:LPS sulfotransferase NodH